MIDSATPLMFFLPDNGLINTPERQKISQYFPATREWERGIFYTEKLNAPYYIARAKNERAVIIGCSGLNTHYLLDPSEVRKLNEAGVSIIWMALPKIAGDRPLVDTYLRLAREFFTSPNSPARILMRSDVPQYALTHSTGGQLFFHLLHEPATRRKLCKMFSGAVHVTPYLDTAHASRDHSPKMVQAIYQKYMGAKPSIPPSERLIAGGYISFNDYLESLNHSLRDFVAVRKSAPQEGLVEASRRLYADFRGAIAAFRPPKGVKEDHPSLDSTCGQILELQRRGQNLTAAFNLEAVKAIPSIFVIGDKDNFACPKTAVDVATKMGAEIIIAPGAYHDPLKTHPHLLDFFIRKVDDCVAMREAAKKTVYVLPPLSREKIEYTDAFDRLRHGAGVTLQGGTGLLNAAAGLFQSALGRRIGNPEMR